MGDDRIKGKWYGIGIIAVALVSFFVGNQMNRGVFSNTVLATSNYWNDHNYDSSHNAQPSTTTQSGEIQYAFPRAGQNPEQMIINLDNSATKTLDVAIYAFTDSKIADAIVAAKKRGVKVRVITDHSEGSTSYQRKVLDEIKAAGITILDNTHSGIMHDKFTVVDGKVVATGSFNYTKSALDKNDENMIVLHVTSVATGYDKEFDAMWNDTKNYAPWGE